MKRDLRDKVIAIAGASSGIGAATALACAEAGMHVALKARRADKLEEVAARIRGLGRRVFTMTGDICCDEDVGSFIKKTVQEFGQLDAAFANAGHGLYGPVAEATDAQARAIFETNFFGTMRMIRAVVPVMRRQGRGHIIICSSAVSEIGLPMYGLYCATKAAQDSIASALRAELADEGIDVSSVHPVGTRTDFFETTRVISGQDEAVFNTPSALTQTPEHVARAIVKCLRRPKPEVWPQPWARLGLAIVTAVPAFNASSMRKLMRQRYACKTPTVAPSKQGGQSVQRSATT